MFIYMLEWEKLGLQAAPGDLLTSLPKIHTKSAVGQLFIFLHLHLVFGFRFGVLGFWGYGCGQIDIDPSA